MSIHKRPPGANAPDPPAAPFDLTNREALRSWSTALREHLLDVLTVAEDRVKPRKKRMFSRQEAARRLAEEERVLLAQLAHLDAALGAGPAPEAPPST